MVCILIFLHSCTNMNLFAEIVLEFHFLSKLLLIKNIGERNTSSVVFCLILTVMQKVAEPLEKCFPPI